MSALVVIFALMVAICVWSSPSDRPMLVMLLASYFYYCIGGDFYWTIYGLPVFSGVYWGVEFIVFAFQILALSTLLLALNIWIFTSLPGRSAQRLVLAPENAPKPDKDRPLPQIFWPLLVVAVGASLWVLVYGSFATQAAFSNPYSNAAPNALFLIAYQTADLLIPLSLYAIAIKGYSRFSILLFAYFLFYATLVGFRYKLALIFFPLLWEQFSLRDSFVNRRSVVVRFGLLGGLGAAVLVFFAVLTLYRRKFGIPDFRATSEGHKYDLMYGLFAETNIIFGLASIIAHYVQVGLHYPFAPVIDSVKEWIPHIFLPSRKTGTYLDPMRFGFVTSGGFDSHTAYPWIGEFLMMFGYGGVIIGPTAVSAIYLYGKSKIVKFCQPGRELLLGVCLLAATAGFYHYSRGYLPQICKAYIFVVVPYIYLCFAGRSPVRAAANFGTRELHRG